MLPPICYPSPFSRKRRLTLPRGNKRGCVQCRLKIQSVFFFWLDALWVFRAVDWNQKHSFTELKLVNSGCTYYKCFQKHSLFFSGDEYSVDNIKTWTFVSFCLPTIKSSFPVGTRGISCLLLVEILCYLQLQASVYGWLFTTEVINNN